MTDYKIIRSDRKTLSLQVTEDCRIFVRAPRYCSEKKIKEFVAENEQWIENAVGKQKKAGERKINLCDADIDYLKSLAGRVLPEKVKHYAEIMGVTYGSVKITSAQKRFGSCSVKNDICFSYMLMLYPEAAIDYVVVHELTHTVHHNHSREFYAFVERILPDYKKREKLLRGPQKLP